jgi:hypothetical protein
VLLAVEITRLEDEAALFVARFWRDFYGSMLAHTIGSAMTKLLLLIVGLAVIPHVRAATQPHLNLVVALDLTKSVGVQGPDGKTEFQKNVDGITRILAAVPAGAHVAVIGITDHSFAQPYILLSAVMPDDAGYFGERLSAARGELVRVWKLRSARLEPRFPATDVLGAFLLAGQIFNQDEGGRVLVIFSDMRNHTRDLNLESALAQSVLDKTGKTVRAGSADLHHVQVYALGVDGAGKPTAYWQGLESFWRGYFRDSGAALNEFSVLRELPIAVLH